jgi:hypothetical protein
LPSLTHPPHLVLQDEVAGVVQGVFVQICLGRKHQQVGQQGVQKEVLPLEGLQVRQAPGKNQ